MTNANNNVAALGRRLTELFDSHDFAALESHMSPGCTAHVGGSDHDRAGWIAMGRSFYEGFPDGRFQIDRQLVADDTAISIGSWGGTHKGSFMGIPPTGRHASMRLILVTRFEDGKATEHWGQFDSGGLLQQLTAR